MHVLAWKFISFLKCSSFHTYFQLITTNIFSYKAKQSSKSINLRFPVYIPKKLSRERWQWGFPSLEKETNLQNNIPVNSLSLRFSSSVLKREGIQIEKESEQVKW